MFPTPIFIAHYIFYLGATAPSGPRPPHCRGFMIILRHTILGRALLDEWSARAETSTCTTHDTHNRKTSMSPAGFEPAIPANERPQNHALDIAETGIGILHSRTFNFLIYSDYAKADNLWPSRTNWWQEFLQLVLLVSSEINRIILNFTFQV